MRPAGVSRDAAKPNRFVKLGEPHMTGEIIVAAGCKEINTLTRKGDTGYTGFCSCNCIATGIERLT